MTDPESASHKLSGVTLNNRWKVLDIQERSVDDTGGAFSVGYHVTDDSGAMAFMKALDYADAFKEDDVPAALNRLTETYIAERDLLRQCGERKLSKIVRALDDGHHSLSKNPVDAVSYLIFELADGDARDVMANSDPADPVPRLRLSHNIAVAMDQLHSMRVAHQDVKPSNILVWDSLSGPTGKLADLGRAYSEGRKAPHDDVAFAGDRTYAAPEHLYGADERLTTAPRRYASDMHMLGSLICFLLVARSYNALLYGSLENSLHWQSYEGTFEEILPALIHAHDSALHRIHDALPNVCADEIVKLIGELCYPDPLLRGDPVARGFDQNPYRLQRYVSRLDLIHRRAAIAMRLVV